MQRDIYNNTKAVLSLAPVSLSSDTATTGIIIDTQGYEAGKIVLQTGVVTAGDITITKIQESDDSGMSGATDIPSTQYEGAIGTAVDATNTTVEVGFWRNKRYIQVTYTTANSANLLATSTAEFGVPDYGSTQA